MPFGPWLDYRGLPHFLQVEHLDGFQAALPDIST
jgi:hypothetical protein